MSSVLNLNIEWTSENFLNYIEHSLYGCVEDWYDGIDEEVKTALRASESPTRMFRQLCRYIELEFIGLRADPNEKQMEYQRKLSNLSICNMKYVDDYIMEFETYYYKIGENETNLGMFYDKLPSPLNEEISEKYQEWREKFLARDALGNIIAFLRKWIEKKCREVAGTQQMKRQFLTCWDFPNNYGCERKNYNKRKSYKKNKFDRSRGETYKKKYYKYKYRKPSRFFKKATYCPEKKKTCKCWSCGELGHYANECKKANHKLMEALESWDYIEIPEDEALELALNNNKGIVEIVEEENEYNEEPEVNDEFEDENYEEINNMMEGEELENSESDDNEEDKSKMKNRSTKKS
ncbi:uncharacterized protein LOC110700113 [Chenopodium quinoa]|uniref:uncharacterized protein LOC110700113 n=1 Tax=Chenopodium quinoa TaxID=63459 RepID=UPI000B78B30C|nr:uncharacterized protein LOC110700113 [Chenopodium quinoa]